MNFTGMVAFQVVLVFFLSALGALSGWLIQWGMFRLHLRKKYITAIGLAAAVVWVLLGIWSGPWVIGLLSVLSQMLVGAMAAYGGRRSDLGRQNAVQILGYRRYLKKVDRDELKRIQKNDPEYFYNQLPFAIALGVADSFAERFGSALMVQCPYFFCGVKERMTAPDWVRFFREAVRIMDEGPRRMKAERFQVIRFR